MDELIKRLVAEYKADTITWHDIQDEVEVFIINQDGKGCTFDKDIIKARFHKEIDILNEIEFQIKGVR